MSAPMSTAPFGGCSRSGGSPSPWRSTRCACATWLRIWTRLLMLVVTPDVSIPDEELEWKFIRSSGPGGQNVNKVASAVQLRFLLPRNLSLPTTAKNRLRRMAGQRLIDDGSIIISARSERRQEQNRRDALERLAELVRAALIEPKIRKKTRPTLGSKERRIESKKRRGTTKQGRAARSWEWWGAPSRGARSRGAWTANPT